MKFFRDTAIVFTREFAPALREPVGLIFAMGQPLLFLFLFGSLLAGTPGMGGWQWFVPGILVMMCLFGPMGAGHSLLAELGGGSLERMLVTPLSRTAMLIGRTAKESIVLLAQAVLIIGLAMTLGLRLYPAGVLLALVMLTVFGIGLSALSFVLAIKSQPSGNLFWIVTQTLMFPVILLSGVLLPMDSGPAWLRVAGAVNPVSYIVDAQRALFSGGLADISVLYGTIAALVIAVSGLLLGTRVMRRGI
ncbi:ABC-2 type transport system permease protein [Kibdelosporangium banguiense]|uniref:Transport permease protein n=1 Tax=Kibdelosporangium banguiense TaxID=1365924 RepID=A0ABS4T9E2_9PSEU|nr:ABC transporter permease [Kibdelosporangium banguiense]MBP2321042.1 ABC-2 type transport system permease protein [Kibdelosporangium banguiense]